MQIHCVYNVHTCQTVKGQVSRSPPTLILSVNIKSYLYITIAREMPLEETSMCEYTGVMHVIYTSKLVNNITQLNICRKPNWAVFIQCRMQISAFYITFIIRINTHE